MLRTSRLVVAATALALTATAARGASRELSWLERYLRFDTTNPPGHEADAAAWMAELLRSEGIATERYVTSSGRVSLIARLPATEPGGGTIALVHHLDVVPAGDGWTAPPFGAEIRGGYLFGRGAVDTKSLGIAHLAALLDAARMPRRAHGLLFLAAADEEAGGGQGMAQLVAARPELLDGVTAAFGEGGFNRTVLGRTFFWGLEVAQKRAYWLTVATRGRPGHGSSLNPDSAVHQLIRSLDRLLERPPEWKLQPPVRDFFAAWIGLDPQLRNRARAEEALGAEGPAAWVPPGWWGLMLDTVQVTELVAGERPNVVPATARATLDARLLPETDAESFLAALRETLGKEVNVSIDLATPPSPPSPTDTEVWKRVAATIGGEAPVLPVMIGGITDSRYLRQRGIAAYGFSPFELEAIELLRVHGPDERIPVATFDAGVERMKRVVRALVAP